MSSEESSNPIKIILHEEHQPEAFNREISWLQFNARVLQEADDASVPLIERLRFLGIYSSNMDEFYRIRMPALTRTAKAAAHALKKHKQQMILSMQEHIGEITLKQQLEVDRIFKKILGLFEKEELYFYNELSPFNEQQKTYLAYYFQETVQPLLAPVWITPEQSLPILKDQAAYFLIEIIVSPEQPSLYALLLIPTQLLPRFVILPSASKQKIVMFIDDVIRLHLLHLFHSLSAQRISAYTFKITRDSELDLDMEKDFANSYSQKIEKSLQKRKHGHISRVVYAADLPEHGLTKLKQGLHFNKDTLFISYGRYHNFRDLMNFPDLGHANWVNKSLPLLNHYECESAKSLLDLIATKDLLLHFPYQRFSYVIDILREASIDPCVTAIKITLYRMAAQSQIVNILSSALHNGKKVIAVIELQARFDEENNLNLAKSLQEEGAEVIFGLPSLKVHSKLLLIERKINKKKERLAYIGTGNFNEKTAKLYTDCALLTSHSSLTKEIDEIFEFLQLKYQVKHFKHLLVAPFNMRKKLLQLIDKEIHNAKKGMLARIDIKQNNLNDPALVKKLYEASQAGVQIRGIIRSVCGIIPGIEGMSENIHLISIIDRFLEHTRLIFFHNAGEEQIYLSSADWMVRNLDHRVEVATPIYDQHLQKQLRGSFELLWQDTKKARVIDATQSNVYRLVSGRKIRKKGQEMVYAYLQKQA